LDAWNAAYLAWLVSSRLGKGEGRATNNHFTWYSVQVLALAVSTTNTTAQADAVARVVADTGTPGALANQIQPDGLMVREAVRDAGATYSTMNVQALFDLARAVGNTNTSTSTSTSSTSTSSAAGVAGGRPMDLWRYKRADGSGSIKAALDFLLEFATNSSKAWPYTQEGAKGWAEFPWTNLATSMRIAAHVYADTTYAKSCNH